MNDYVKALNALWQARRAASKALQNGTGSHKAFKAADAAYAGALHRASVNDWADHRDWTNQNR
jgi:hypothetical protein